MKRLRLAIELFFQRQGDSGGDSSSDFDRMAREIIGSIFTLVTLLELVALTSYVPIDSFNIYYGHLDHMNNLAGIVGAIASEWFLGTTGIGGYGIVILTAWLAISSFKGSGLREHFFKMFGTVIASVLFAIACQLALKDRFPEASLLQGGMVGKTVGSQMRLWFNTTGALIIVGGAFLLTSILTFGLSLISLTNSLMNEGEDAEADAKALANVVPFRPTATAAPAPAPAAPTAKRAPRKKRAVTVDPNDPDAVAASQEVTAEIDLNAATAGAAAGDGAFPFRELIPASGSYSMPSLRLLKNAEGGSSKMSKGQIKEISKQLCEHLLSFQITGEVTHVSQGPVLITYEFKPSAGIKLSKIANLQEDLGLVLGARGLRIVAPIPGKTVVGIEVPKTKIDMIPLKEILAEDDFYDKKIRLPVALGKNTEGKAIVGDLAAMPHLLVAGTTGSGKSVFINSLIMSFLYRMTPQQLRLILIDPKMLELVAFEGIPHLVGSVITNNNYAKNALNWAVDEMERRYSLMAQTGSKNLESYNAKMKGDKKFPYIVVVIDELADLMMTVRDDVETAIARLAQKARAAGIHLVIATQRPSSEVITGLIKANIPSRLSFKVPSAIDSRTVLDTSGAEELIGRGDSLMSTTTHPLRRLHGCFVSEEELARVMKYVIGGKNHSKNYIQFQ